MYLEFLVPVTIVKSHTGEEYPTKGLDHYHVGGAIGNLKEGDVHEFSEVEGARLKDQMPAYWRDSNKAAFEKTVAKRAASLAKSATPGYENKTAQV